jgi:NADPH-dependent 2,4-dienoyl-CoA reductase/sulfur reductase-like enzyme
MSKIIIIGGVAAGMSAAAKARRINPNSNIIVYSNETYISYAGCGLPYFIGNNVRQIDHLLARTVEQFFAQNILVKKACQVLKIEPDQNKVLIKDLQTQQKFYDHYDKLIIATGARPLIPELPGVNLPGIFVLRNITDSLAIKAYLEKQKPAHLVIVGAGYIGLEMVENLLDYPGKITLLEKSSHIIPNMDNNMAAILSNYIAKQGVEVKTDINIIAFQGQDRVEQVITNEGVVDADFVLLSTGVVPNSELALSAGIELGIRNAIRVNEKMETNLKNIYAAGDCCTVKHLVTQQEAYIPLGTTANKQGKVAGENAAGGNSTFKGVIGTGISRILAMEIARTGLTEKECQTADIDYIVSDIKSKTKAGYLPHANDIYVRIVAEKKHHYILGGQIIGYPGAGKRIDVLAAAITLHATIEQLIDMDLAYAPPFSPVWDPILIALNNF